MKNRAYGFILCAIFFSLLYGWKGLLGTILLFLCLCFAKSPQPECPKKKNQSAAKDDDTAILGAICGDN